MEVTIGLLELYPAEVFYPLFVLILENLAAVAQGLGTLIPYLPYVLRLLKNKGFYTQFEEKSEKEFDFEIRTKVTAEHTSQNRFWHDLLLRLTHLVVKGVGMFVGSPAFLELTAVPLKALKSLYKKRMSLQNKATVKRTVISSAAHDSRRRQKVQTGGQRSVR